MSNHVSARPLSATGRSVSLTASEPETYRAEQSLTPITCVQAAFPAKEGVRSDPFLLFLTFHREEIVGQGRNPFATYFYINWDPNLFMKMTHKEKASRIP